jgi:hypothetical protein
MIPTGGYRSRTAFVLAKLGEGLSHKQIAAELGIPVENVHALEYSGRRGKRRSNGQADERRTVVFPGDVLDQLEPHAATRQISVNELCRRLVETAVEAGMIDAILDDREGTP